MLLKYLLKKITVWSGKKSTSLYQMLTIQVKKEAERADREFDILQDYPAYYDDEKVYEQRDNWLADFISQVPPAKQDDIRQLIKENTEII